MASILPGYEYDIFVSYRQKDNGYDGWVNEFVDNLKRELHATFKEEISIYFDANPTDGLLENHIVDESLAKKLKSLIFLPIISQTYCDPQSFAWKHELCSFNRSAKDDQIGRDIKLAGGNVASRILPVKINDLETEDKELLENELGGTLRSIEFIYKAPGVNRPLKPNDERAENINHTYYRDQINKVANAVKEIISALKKQDNPNEIKAKETVRVNPAQPKIPNVKSFSWIIIILALFISGYFLLPKFLRSSEETEKSIAVLPFINDSPSDSTKYFINGIMAEVLNDLQSIRDFRVLSRTSTEKYQGSSIPSIPEIARKLRVNYVVQGSGQKYGKNFRLRVQLTKADKESQLWAKSYQQEINDMGDIFDIQNEIAQSIASELKTTLSPEEKRIIEKIPTSSLTAYDFYQRGRDELPEFWIEVDDWDALSRAYNYYRKALKIDPSFADAYVGLAEIYFVDYKLSGSASQNYLDSVRVLANLALSHDNKLSEAYFVKGNYYTAKGFKDSAATEFGNGLKLNINDWMAYYGKAKLFQHDDFVLFLDNLYKALRINQNGRETPTICRMIGGAYLETGFPDKAKFFFARAFELDSDSSFYLSCLGGFEHDQGNYQNSAEYCKRALLNKPDYWEVTDRLISDLYGYGQYIEVLKYYKKFKYFSPQVAYTYFQTGSGKKAQDIFNKIKINSDSIIGSNRYNGQVIQAYYDLACIYSFRGDINNALKYFKSYSQIKNCELWRLTAVRHEPLLNNLRNNSEFQQYLKDLENKYQAEHDRVGKWLEGQGRQ